MGNIDEVQAIDLGGQYGDIVAINEYNGSYSIVSARRSDSGDIWMEWAFPQRKGKKPAEKAIPFKIKIGNDREQAIQTLEALLAMLTFAGRGDYEGGGGGGQGHGKKRPPSATASEPRNGQFGSGAPPDDDIPF